MRLGRIAVLLVGLGIIITLTCISQVVDYFSMEVSEAVLVGYKEDQSCIEFKAGDDLVNVCSEFPIRYFTGDKVTVIYDPEEPRYVKILHFGYWLDQQTFPMMLIIVWASFSLAYVGRNQVIIVGMEGKLFQRASRTEEHYFMNDREHFI